MLYSIHTVDLALQWRVGNRGGKPRLQVDCDTFNLDNEIDRLLYCLWSLTDNEIAVVKSVTLGYLCLCRLYLL